MANINGRMLSALEFVIPSEPVQQAVARFLSLFRERLHGNRLQLSDLPIPLADVPNLLTRIEELAVEIREARRLRQEAKLETSVLWQTSLRSVLSSYKYPEVALAEVCAEIIDNLHSNPVYAESGVPCVRSPDVGWGTLHLETALKTDETEYRHRTVRGEPQADDIVLVREGGGTGKAAMVAPGQRFSLGQRVMMLRPDKEKVLPKFFLYQILSPLIQDDHIAPLSKGSAAPHLNIGSLRTFPFRLPSLDKQRRILAELDQLQVEVEGLKRLQAETDTEINALLPSVLSRAFAGDLL